MALPYFYIEQLSGDRVVLDEDTSKHVVQVLRKKTGDELLLTDGKGAKARALIVDDNRKRCAVRLESLEREEEAVPKVAIAISLIKNTARFEWFLEKATEVGVSEIIPLICERTEKEKFRFERLNAILISAMLQSQQCWLPVLREPVEFSQVVSGQDYACRFIAHCLPEEKRSLIEEASRMNGDRMILIGPEGDFSEREIEQALAKGFVPVSLGRTRLRTETAGIVAATLMVS